jgi:asparagine synthase (glutamine-hydrolysing)
MLIASFAADAEADGFAARFPDRLRRPAPRLLVWADPGPWPQVPAPLLGLQGQIVDRRRARLLPPDAVAAAIAADGADAFADWAPAFRLAWTNGAAAFAAADHNGLGHWFTWTAPGIAVIAASATLIARRFGLGIDTAALGGLALTGAMVGLDSAITGVAKLAAGHIACVSEGRLTLNAMPAASVLADPRDAASAAVTRLLAAHGDCEIELSGGWDSRWMLAGVPRDRRAHLSGFTIGDGDDPDVRIARLLAAQNAMPHAVVDLSGLAALDPVAFRAALAGAAARDDYGGNPLDRAGINLINARRRPVARFSGQNGEIMRGFYYPGQPLGAMASPALARRVIDWRIISNDVVSAAMFDPAWLADTRAAVSAWLERLLVEPALPWADALDRFYLEQRMHRWCGAAVSATLGERPVLLPFFDADVLALARATPAADKAGSRFVARDIVRLDPALAAIRLASGMVPAAIARGGIGSRVGRARQFASKAGAKIRQQLAGRDVATARSITTAALVMAHKLHHGIDVQKMAELNIFSLPALEDFARGTADMTRSTVGFLLNLQFLLENIDEN